MSDNSSTDFFSSLDWDEPSENLLISWADISLCYHWLFDQNYRKLNAYNYRFSIPIIVLSTITGTISMSVDSLFPSDYTKQAQIALGSVNIFTGIITTLQNFFRYAQLSEANLAASNDWAKLHRVIKIELSIERQCRKPASEFVKSIRQEYERLLNNRPILTDDIINKFKNEFKNVDIIKPEIVDKIQHTFLEDDRYIVNYYQDVKRRLASMKPSFFEKMKSSISGTPIKSPVSSTEGEIVSLKHKLYNQNLVNSPSINTNSSPNKLNNYNKQLQDINKKYKIGIRGYSPMNNSSQINQSIPIISNSNTPSKKLINTIPSHTPTPDSNRQISLKLIKDNLNHDNNQIEIDIDNNLESLDDFSIDIKNILNQVNIDTNLDENKSLEQKIPEDNELKE